MNTNSLAVYCAPPTNAPALSESALHADVYDRVIDMTNLVQLAAIYDMMCERVDVPQWGFTYSRNKRLRTFGGIGTNRNAIAASRVLKYAPLVQLCGDVCDFLKSASATNMGFYTVYPLTFGFDFDDAGNRDTWTDVTTPTGTVSDAYSIGDVVLSPGRDNYGYQLAFGFSADVMQNYDPSSSVIPFWLGALGGVTHYAAPGSSYEPSRLRDLASRALAAVLLVPAAPVLLLCGLAIRLETPGPALFVQERYGLGNRKFRMLKFRTMVADAEAKLDALRARNETDGALFKLHDDPRVTRVGHFLRKTSLDELPQLINIARGEMRFVGPRPLPCADMDPWLGSWQGFRQTVPPGLTCIWQVSGRSDVGFEAMAMLDNWYALNRSWVLDVRILARTLWSVVFGSGAY